MTQNRQLGDLAQLVTVNTAASSIQVGNTTIHSNGVTVGNTSIHTTGIIVDGQSINNTSFPGTANNTSFVGSVSAANVVSNAQLSANLSNYQTTAGLSSNVATLTANNASFLGGTAAASYQLNSTLSANVATLTANNTSFVGSVSAANVVSNAQLSSNLSNYQTTAGLNANIASYLPTYTGIVNGSVHSVGSSFIANSTGVYTGVVNATTITTGSVNVVNASGLTTSANVSIGAAGELIIAAGAGIFANGGLGSAGEVLHSNGSSIYWATDDQGVTSVSGTSGRITSSGGTTPAIDLATAGAGAASYSSGISALTVDAYGRVTSVTGSAGYLTGITSGQVTTALGYTPYNSTNPSGYITSSASITGTAAGLSGLYTATNSSVIAKRRNRIHPSDGTSMDTTLIGQLECGFNYGTSSGVTGPYITFGGLGGVADYQAQFTTNYGDATVWKGRCRNDDNSTWSSWRTFLIEDVWINSKHFGSDGNIYSNASMRAPIFYDQNDTARYVDPNGTSILNNVQAHDWFRNHGEQGLYSQSYGQHFYPDSGGYWWECDGGIRIREGYEGTIRGHLGYHDGNGFGILNSSGNWQIRMEFGNANMELYNITFANDIRPYIMYDRNDTAYYVDPNSWCRLNAINVNTILSQDNWWLDGGGNARMLWATGSHNYYRTWNWHVFRNSGNGDTHYLAGDGNIWTALWGDWVSSQWRSPIFYDYNDTNFYCDPNATTRINNLTVIGTGGKTLIQTLTASNSSSLATTNCFTTTYKYYMVVFNNLLAGTAQTAMYMRLYISGAYQASNYRSYTFTFNVGGSAAYGPTTYIDLGGSTRNRVTSGDGFVGHCMFFNPAAAIKTRFLGHYNLYDWNIDGISYGTYNGLYLTAASCTGFQVFASSGNIASGEISIYGWN